MDFESLLQALDDEKYSVLQRAVELGKWPDGRRLSEEERASSLRVLIAYDARHKQEEERIGYIPPKADPCVAKTGASENIKSKINSENTPDDNSGDGLIARDV